MITYKLIVFNEDTKENELVKDVSAPVLPREEEIVVLTDEYGKEIPYSIINISHVIDTGLIEVV